MDSLFSLDPRLLIAGLVAACYVVVLIAVPVLERLLPASRDAR